MNKFAELMGHRVTVSGVPMVGDVTGFLHGVSPDQVAYLFDADAWTTTELVGWTGIKLSQLTCETCGQSVDTLASGDCANCARDKARNRRNGVARCEECGGSSAFRNPRVVAGRYLCISCHDKAGSLPVRPADRAPSACAGQPHDDERHSWVRVRGFKHRCGGCGSTSFEVVR